MQSRSQGSGSGARVRVGLATFGLVAAGLTVVAPPAMAAGIVVDSLADTTTAGDGDCTLREAITNANANADTTNGDCAAGGGADVITVTATGKVQLSAELPGIGDAAGLTISGPGAAALSIAGNGQADGTGGILGVGPGSTLTLQKLTITGGNATSSGYTNPDGIWVSQTPVGGGILNFGVLTIEGVTFSGNAAGFGGAIYNGSPAVLTVVDSVLNGNSAKQAGGAIANYGTLTVLRSAFVGNASGSAGSAIFSSGPATVRNSTFVTNSPAAVANAGSLTVTSSTFLANAKGAISTPASSPHAAVSGTALSGGGCSGPILDSGHNVEDGTSCGFTAATSMSSTDPKLGTLANNGGPTPTVLPLAGSPLLDAIPAGTDGLCPTGAGAPATDQRGVARPQGTACDIGAVEVAVTPVDPPVDPPVTPPVTPPAVTPPPASPPVVTPVTTTTTARTYFRYRSSTLTSAQKRDLRALVATIPAGATITGKATGVVRAEGATTADRARALARAKAVRAYLRTLGVTEVSVSNKGRTTSTSAKARRVNVTLTYTTG